MLTINAQDLMERIWDHASPGHDLRYRHEKYIEAIHDVSEIIQEMVDEETQALDEMMDSICEGDIQ